MSASRCMVKSSDLLSAFPCQAGRTLIVSKPSMKTLSIVLPVSSASTVTDSPESRSMPRGVDDGLCVEVQDQVEVTVSVHVFQSKVVGVDSCQFYRSAIDRGGVKGGGRVDRHWDHALALRVDFVLRVTRFDVDGHPLGQRDRVRALHRGHSAILIDCVDDDGCRSAGQEDVVDGRAGRAGHRLVDGAVAVSVDQEVEIGRLVGI